MGVAGADADALADIQSSSFAADRSQKSIGLLTGSPSFAPVEGFDKEEADGSNATRVFKYSPDGRRVAMAMDKQWVRASRNQHCRAANT